MVLSLSDKNRLKIILTSINLHHNNLLFPPIVIDNQSAIKTPDDDFWVVRSPFLPFYPSFHRPTFLFCDPAKFSN